MPILIVNSVERTYNGGDVTAAFEDQELRTPESTGVAYWEGSVATEGASGDKKIRGRGYLEMTGYAGQSMGAILH